MSYRRMYHHLLARPQLLNIWVVFSSFLHVINNATNIHTLYRYLRVYFCRIVCGRAKSQVYLELLFPLRLFMVESWNLKARQKLKTYIVKTSTAQWKYDVSQRHHLNFSVVRFILVMYFYSSWYIKNIIISTYNKKLLMKYFTAF